jgi:hypothetical protein
MKLSCCLGGWGETLAPAEGGERQPSHQPGCALHFTHSMDSMLDYLVIRGFSCAVLKKSACFGCLLLSCRTVIRFVTYALMTSNSKRDSLMFSLVMGRFMVFGLDAKC